MLQYYKINIFYLKTKKCLDRIKKILILTSLIFSKDKVYMKKYCVFTYLIYMVFFIGFLSCKIVPQQITTIEKQILLENELSRWNSFRITGMTELQYQAFSIRGQAVISKVEDKFRFDILNQGILGLGGGVLMAVYADSEQVQARMFGSSAIESYDIDSRIGEMVSFLSENLYQIIYEQREKIFETFMAEVQGFEIYFTNEMKLREISVSEQNIKVNFIYDRQDNLTELRVLTPLTRNFTIFVDRVVHENILVLPLR